MRGSTNPIGVLSVPNGSDLDPGPCTTEDAVSRKHRVAGGSALNSNVILCTLVSSFTNEVLRVGEVVAFEVVVSELALLRKKGTVFAFHMQLCGCTTCALSPNVRVGKKSAPLQR